MSRTLRGHLERGQADLAKHLGLGDAVLFDAERALGGQLVESSPQLNPAGARPVAASLQPGDQFRAQGVWWKLNEGLAQAEVEEEPGCGHVSSSVAGRAVPSPTTRLKKPESMTVSPKATPPPTAPDAAPVGLPGTAEAAA